MLYSSFLGLLPEPFFASRFFGLPPVPA